MSPTLGDGDDILVDRGDAAERLRDGIYVIRMDDALMVKRLSMRPAHRLAVLSDNPAYPGWPDVDARAITIIGRVVWSGYIRTPRCMATCTRWSGTATR